MSPDRMSVVIAAYQRVRGLQNLLDDLARQSLPASSFEVVVVDDGSEPPIASGVRLPRGMEARVLRQANAGPAAARHHGILAATGTVVVILDDDMRIPAEFLHAHRAAHATGYEVVLGLIKPPDEPRRLPLFERLHAEWLTSIADRAMRGRPISGTHLATGNFSIRRELYERIGGFDLSIPQSEDREIGIRLERARARFGMTLEGFSIHESDHTDRDLWLRRTLGYGVWDSRIAAKHADVPAASPWRYVDHVRPGLRPLLLAAAVVPGLAEPLARTVMRIAERADATGLERLAMSMTRLSYGLCYVAGVCADAGSPVDAWRSWRRHRSRAAGR